MKIKFFKLFNKLEEGEMFNGIIDYSKKEHELFIEDETFHECVLSYRYFLRINLWFVILEFDWIKKGV